MYIDTFLTSGIIVIYVAKLGPALHVHNNTIIHCDNGWKVVPWLGYDCHRLSCCD